MGNTKMGLREPKYAALTGKAGEYIVAGQLMLRGLNVFWPASDTGCDIMTDNLCRLQVRSAHLYHRKEYGPLYFFPLPKNRRVPNSDKTTILVVRKKFSEICDFVVFHGIEQNRFWIVPAALCDECTGVELGTESTLRRFTGSIKEMREMLALGYNRGQVAKHYGIERTSLQQFLDSGKDFVNVPVATRMRACENAWQHILDFGAPAAIMQEPELVIVPIPESES
jgi:hypothetical protein